VEQPEKKEKNYFFKVVCSEGSFKRLEGGGGGGWGYPKSGFTRLITYPTPANNVGTYLHNMKSKYYLQNKITVTSSPHLSRESKARIRTSGRAATIRISKLRHSTKFFCELTGE
jgi:hypothetical protein